MNKLTINELNKILDEYNINEADIVGTGKNGRIVKIDIVNAIESYLTKNDIYDPRHSPKPVVKPKSKTAGLKKGDLILYHDDDGLEFKAIVENVTATTKAQIRALNYIDKTFNPNTIVNTYRKYMTIIEPAKNINITLTINDGQRTKTFDINNVHPDKFDAIVYSISDLFENNNIKFMSS